MGGVAGAAETLVAYAGAVPYRTSGKTKLVTFFANFLFVEWGGKWGYIYPRLVFCFVAERRGRKNEPAGGARECPNLPQIEL